MRKLIAIIVFVLVTVGWSCDQPTQLSILSPVTTIDCKLDSQVSVQLTAIGGKPPYTWSTSGTLPSGVNVNANGLISGTCQHLGSYTFTVVVTDSTGIQSNVTLGR